VVARPILRDGVVLSRSRIASDPPSLNTTQYSIEQKPNLSPITMKKLILASTSPRRKEVLEKTGLSFEVVPSDYEEDMTLDLPPEELAEFLSAGKARAVAAKNPGAVVVAADTFVVHEHHRLGKPHTNERAKEMLQLLSGKAHYIVTGVTIISDTGQVQSFHEKTAVHMAELSEELIDQYIATGEPLDKAGAYALQELGAMLVEKIEGDFFNAMGLPLRRLVHELRAFGVEVF